MLHSKNIIPLLLLLVGLSVCSCVTTRRVNYMQEPSKLNHIPTYADTLHYEEYTLRKGDRIYVYVYSLDETISRMYNAGTNGGSYRQQMMAGGGANNGSYELYSYLVDDEGNIDFPTLGKIPVHGLTTRQTKYLLEEKLSTLLASHPGYSSVSCEVNIVQRSYSVVGMQSGRYNITKEKMTIFEAIAQAGNLGEYSDKGRIKIVREKDGVTTVKEFDVRSKDIINSEYYYVEPNDIIYVRRFNGYSFGVNHFTAAFGIVTTTLSFGVFVFTIVQTGIQHMEKYGKKE